MSDFNLNNGDKLFSNTPLAEDWEKVRLSFGVKEQVDQNEGLLKRSKVNRPNNIANTIKQYIQGFDRGLLFSSRFCLVGTSSKQIEYPLALESVLKVDFNSGKKIPISGKFFNSELWYLAGSLCNAILRLIFFKDIIDCDSYGQGFFRGKKFQICLHNALRNKLRKLYRKNNVEVSFIVCSYRRFTIAAIAAARMEGVLTVDIQHGVAGSRFWPFQNLEIRSKYCLPDVFWSWSSYEASQYPQAFKSFVLGPVSSFKSSEHELEDLTRWRKENHGRRIYVYTEQVGFTENFINLVEEKDSQVAWIVKLHPLSRLTKEDVDTFSKEMRDYTFFFVKGKELSFEDISIYADRNFTESSASAIDFFYHMIPTTFFCEFAKIYFDPKFFETGWFSIFGKEGEKEKKEGKKMRGLMLQQREQDILSFRQYMKRSSIQL